MTDGRDGKLADLGIKLLGGTAAGVGVLGLVTLVGGAVVEAQLAGAGLPASRAVADLPRADLLVIGARLLAPFVGVLSVAFLGVAAVERYEAAKTGGRARLGMVLVLVGLGLALTRRVADMENAQPWVWLVCVAVAILALVGMWMVRESSWPIFVVAGGVAAILAAVVSGYVLTYAEPEVRPVALVERDGRALVGIYAAANSEEVAVGEVCTFDGGAASRGDASAGSIVVLPRADVAAMAIGTNGSLRTAIRKEKGLLASIDAAAALHLPRGGPPYVIGSGRTPPALCSDPAAAGLRTLGRGGNLFLGP